MRAVVAAGTDIGHVREGNEDTYLVIDPLFVVADGMGGHRGGEVASQLAVETMEHRFALGEGALAELIREANRAVFERSTLDRAVAGMGTTLTAALVENDRIRLAHVGDSRAYLLRDGELRQLTDDHTLVHRMVEDGELTAAEAEVHPHRSILTRSVGVDLDVDVDELDLEARAGDRLLICSDGLTGMLPDPRIADILREEPDPHRAVRRLIAEANEAGGVDNITAILIDIQEGDPAPSPVMGTRAESRAPDDPVQRAPTTETGGRPLADARTRWPRVATWAGIGLAILVLAFVGFRVYLDTQWYVGVSDGRVAVFRGIPAEVAGFELHHVVVETAIAAEDALALALYRDLDEGITAADRASADAIVQRIRDDLARAGGAIEGPSG